MPNEFEHPSASPLSGIAGRYPKETSYLGRVFNDTTNSYKLLWFRAILALLQRSEEPRLQLVDIIREMAVLAWPPVCLYRLSLGRQDKLQEVLASIREASRLEAKAKPGEVRDFIKHSTEFTQQLGFLGRYVPTRFLAVWFQDELRGMPDGKRDATIRTLATQSQRSSSPSPYWFEDGCIRLNAGWATFLRENMAVVEAFAKHHCALFLQARNPSVPGIVKKLHSPTERQLTAAHGFWHFIREELAIAGRSSKFCDIYTLKPLEGAFTVDHFLPWSFVVHDLLWNLTPVEGTTNSSKNDALPKLDIYLPRLAGLHFEAIRLATKTPRLLDDYVECFQMDVRALADLSLASLTEKYRAVIAPQAQIAANQGFPAGWVFRNSPQP